jgi:hypothetical protein
MYVHTMEGLGTDVRNGHIRQSWSECRREGTRQRRCDITFRVKFRPNFGDFRRETERALKRWMTGARARTLIGRLEETLRRWHQEISDLNYPENAPICLLGQIIYRGLNGTWRVVDVLLQAHMTFTRARIESGVPLRCF